MSEFFMAASHSWASFSSAAHEIKGGSALFNMNSMHGRWFTLPVQVGWPSLQLASNLLFVFCSCRRILSSSFSALEFYRVMILFRMLSLLAERLQKYPPVADC
jgi:hypothetical protein